MYVFQVEAGVIVRETRLPHSTVLWKPVRQRTHLEEHLRMGQIALLRSGWSSADERPTQGEVRKLHQLGV